MDLVPSFCNDLNQHQTVTRKTLQNILSCSETEAIELLQHLEACKMIEKLRGSSLYFVTPDAGEFLSYILESYSRYATDGELAQAWEMLKAEFPQVL